MFPCIPLLTSVFIFTLATVSCPFSPPVKLLGLNDTAALEKRWYRKGRSVGYWPDATINYCLASSIPKSARGKLVSWLDDGWQLWSKSHPEIAHITFQQGNSEICSPTNPDKRNVLTIMINSDKEVSTQIGGFKAPQITVDISYVQSSSYPYDPTVAMAHEIGHAWGLEHEHQRLDFWDMQHGGSLPDGNMPNRFDCTALADYARFQNDPQYTQDYLDNTLCKSIIPAIQAEFSAQQYLPLKIFADDTQGQRTSGSIDYDSLMMYPGTAGGKNKKFSRGRATVMADQSNNALKLNTVPSASDIQGLLFMYPCRPPGGSRKRQSGDDAPVCGIVRHPTTIPAAPTNAESATTILEPTGSGTSPPLTETAPSGTQGGSSATLGSSAPLKTTGIGKGIAVKAGTELRILPVGDSITVGFESGDGNGYRLELQQDLKGDKVVFAGTESGSGMCDGYYAAWSGQTISYISSHVGPSLAQRPNIILLHAGTNDMNAGNAGQEEGDAPNTAARRLGGLIDQMTSACPDATILVAVIINTIQTASESSAGQEDRTRLFQALIPGVVATRRQAGHHVIAVDFSTLPLSDLNSGGVHLTNPGYDQMGDWWYDYVHQIPSGWINDPVGPDPNRPPCSAQDIGANGGPDPAIPPPDFGSNPVEPSSSSEVAAAARAATDGDLLGEPQLCTANPDWEATGQIALGLGHNGDWRYHQNWVSAGRVADGLHLDHNWVRLVDMDADGKADYLWLDPDSGELTCWINHLPGAWAPAGTNHGIIASGAAPGAQVFFADMNGDGFTDYLVVDGNTGSVNVYWNYGPDASWANGWKFIPGGQIASGVPHANLATLRFPDINGDGRADYVIMGVGGSLGMWLNTGEVGSQQILFQAIGGIATGASPDLGRLVFADINGDGRDDYLIWDDEGGLTGFLNQPTQRDGVPFFVNQGPAKSIAVGGSNSQPLNSVILADLDGDGKDDYCYIDPADGAIVLWWNRGTADSSMAGDGLRFADIDGDGMDDYVWVDPTSGAPTVYINQGPDPSDSLGWLWSPLNGGNPIASGTGAGALVHFGDIDGDHRDDYLVINAETGAMFFFLNVGPDGTADNGYRWDPIGIIAAGLGPGKNTRIADIDGDGRVDYIQLDSHGGTNIYLNQYRNGTLDTDFFKQSGIDASGIGQRPEEISFYDINGDGKADYIWTNAVTGATAVWLNNYPNQPQWLAQGTIRESVGAAGANVRYGRLQLTGRNSYVAVNPNSGAIAAWLNGCSAGDSVDRPLRTGGFPCVEMVADLDNDLGPDFMTVSVTEDGKLTCDNADAQGFLTSDETQWVVDCGSGVQATYTGDEYGRVWHYKNPNTGVYRLLDTRGGKPSRYVCSERNGVDIYCSNTVWDNQGACPGSSLDDVDVDL